MTHEDAGPEIDRGDLRQLLLDSLAAGTVRWNSKVKDVHPEADGRWRIEFEGQESVSADLVVGADGLGSRVRHRLTQVRPRYVGMTRLAAYIRKQLWRGSELADVLGEGSVMYVGGDKTIFVQRCNRDVILLYYTLWVAEKWPQPEGFSLKDTEKVLGTVKAAYADWSPAVIDMLTQIDGNFHCWPISVMPPDAEWETVPGLSLIGDASHVMPSFTGKGVNLALLDALELTERLTADPTATITDAVKAFERRMQERTKKETGQCLEVGKQIYGIDIDFSKS